MAKINYITLFFFILINIYSQKTFSKLKENFLTKKIDFFKKNKNNEIKKEKIIITSKNILFRHPGIIEYEGCVNVKKNNQNIISNRVKIYKNDKYRKNFPIIVFDGNVKYSDPNIILNGLKAVINFNNRNIVVKNGNYFIIKNNWIGFAEKISLDKEKNLVFLEKGSFSTCFEERKIWNFFGSKILLNNTKEYIEIWDSYFKFFNIPIFYIPYLKLSFSNKLKFDLLMPNIKFLKNFGTVFSFPFKWKITKKNYAKIILDLINLNLFKIKNKFYYFNKYGSGFFLLDFIKSRKIIFDQNKENLNKKNWLIHWKHNEILNNFLRLNIDYTKISDKKNFLYFLINNKYSNFYFPQKFLINYLNSNWNFSIKYEKFHFFIDSLNKNIYRLEPQINFNYYNHNLSFFNIKKFISLSRMVNNNKNIPDIIRFYSELEANFPFSNSYGNFNNSLRLMTIYYNYINFHSWLNKSYNHIFFLIPSFKNDAHFLFLNKIFIKKKYIQTIEPRLNYIYTPLSNKNYFKNQDLSFFYLNYNSLFYDQFFNGLDRIYLNNKLSMGITTRIYDHNLFEFFNFSIGKVYNFKKKLNNLNFFLNKNKNNQLLNWIFNFYFNLKNDFKVQTELQYDDFFKKFYIGDVNVSYYRQLKNYFQFSYRFINKSYFENIIKDKRLKKNDISQAKTSINYFLSNQWSLYCSYNYDFNKKQTINKLISLNYRNSCFSIKIGYESNIMAWLKQRMKKNWNEQIFVKINLLNLKKEDMDG